jgi:hypothetical protein
MARRVKDRHKKDALPYRQRAKKTLGGVKLCCAYTQKNLLKVKQVCVAAFAYRPIATPNERHDT